MFRNKLITPLLCICFLCILSGCKEQYPGASKKRIADEELAAEYLEKARAQMNAHDYDAARKTIKEMRDTCRLAFTGREAGILLMDSIELFIAEADTSLSDRQTRVEFYQKKILHDKKQNMINKNKSKEN